MFEYDIITPKVFQSIFENDPLLEYVLNSNFSSVIPELTYNFEINFKLIVYIVHSLMNVNVSIYEDYDKVVDEFKSYYQCSFIHKSLIPTSIFSSDEFLDIPHFKENDKIVLCSNIEANEPQENVLILKGLNPEEYVFKNQIQTLRIIITNIIYSSFKLNDDYHRWSIQKNILLKFFKNSLDRYVSDLNYRKTIHTVSSLRENGIFHDSAYLLASKYGVYVTELSKILESSNKSDADIYNVEDGLYLTIESSKYQCLYKDIFGTEIGKKKMISQMVEDGLCFSTTRRRFLCDSNSSVVRRLHFHLNSFVNTFFANDVLKQIFINNKIEFHNKNFVGYGNNRLYDPEKELYKFYSDNFNSINSFYDRNVRVYTILRAEKLSPKFYRITYDNGRYCALTSKMVNVHYLKVGQPIRLSYLKSKFKINENGEKYRIPSLSSFVQSYENPDGTITKDNLQFSFIFDSEEQFYKGSKKLVDKYGLCPFAKDTKRFLGKLLEFHDKEKKLNNDIVTTKSKIYLFEKFISDIDSESKNSKFSIDKFTPYGCTYHTNSNITADREFDSLSNIEDNIFYKKNCVNSYMEIKDALNSFIDELKLKIKSYENEISKYTRERNVLSLMYTLISPIDNSSVVEKLLELGYIKQIDVFNARRVYTLNNLYKVGNFILSREAYFAVKFSFVLKYQSDGRENNVPLIEFFKLHDDSNISKENSNKMSNFVVNECRNLNIKHKLGEHVYDCSNNTLISTLDVAMKEFKKSFIMDKRSNLDGLDESKMIYENKRFLSELKNLLRSNSHNLREFILSRYSGKLDSEIYSYNLTQSINSIYKKMCPMDYMRHNFFRVELSEEQKLNRCDYVLADRFNSFVITNFDKEKLFSKKYLSA